MSGCKSKKPPDDSSRRKRPRVTTGDRIGDLGDSILGNILSLLPTKDAVATGILSKRWKLLWTTTINLDFCFPKNHTGSKVQFYHFVNSVLGLHKPGYLNRFSLTWEKGCFDPFFGTAWISAAFARNVHELFVRIEMSKLPNETQTCIFSSESLQSLELNCTQCISSDIIVSLPRLERLSLVSVYFQSEEAFCKVLDGCPRLTYLVVDMDIGKMIRHGYMKKVKGVAFKCIVSSPSLRHLELLAYGKHPKRNGYRALCGVQLDAPSLRYIYVQQIYSIVVQTRLTVLDEANIHLTSLKHKTKAPNYCNSFVEALEAFDYAKSLNLSGEVTRALSCGTVKMTASFDRLTRLEVSIASNYWSSVQNFIELSDNLEFLIIELDEVEHVDEDEDEDEDDSEDDDDSDSDTEDDSDSDSDTEDDSNSEFDSDSDDDSDSDFEDDSDSDDEDEDGSEDEDVNMSDNDLNDSKWKKPNIVPRCLSNTLKRFSIGVFHGHHDELEMVSYILEHGSVLQVMQIYLDESIIDSKTNFKLVQKISKFPKKSHVCEVKYCSGLRLQNSNSFSLPW